MKVHITKCLCPDNHLIMAFSWHEPSYTAETAVQHLKEAVEELIKGAGPRPWCSICKTNQFHYEDEVADEETAEAAMGPFIQKALASVRVQFVRPDFSNN
jgi:hypothetical protein